MKIAGINLQELENDCKVQHAVSEPYGLQMILAVAKEQGHDVGLFLNAKEEGNDIIGISEDEMINKICEWKPDIAAFSLYTCYYDAGKRIAKKLKQRLPDIITVAGNRYPTYLKYSEDPFDFFVVKEGEETFKELLNAIQNGKKYENVAGIAFKKDGKHIFTGVRERNFNLDSLPNSLRFPIILKQVYKAISLPSLSKDPHYAIMEYSRCCYNNCKFCDNGGFWGNKVVFRSPKRVVDEMFELKKKNVDIFYFMDLNFTAFPEKTKELCRGMIRRKLNASWYCMSNVATVDSDEGTKLLRLMKKAGCYKIAWGVESTDDNALKMMNKKVGKNLTTNRQTKRVLKKSLEAGIINQGFYIIGFPWETQKSIIKDSEFLKDVPLHQLNIGVFTPIPLSRFYGDMVKGGYVFHKDLQKHNRNTLIFNHRRLVKPSSDPYKDIENGNKIIKKLQKKIYDNFYRSSEYLRRLKKTCRIDPRFRQAFNEYFEFTGKKVRI